MIPNLIIDFDTTFATVDALNMHSQIPLKRLITILKKNITPSVKRNKQFFKKYKEHIYIVSEGMIEYVFPVVKKYGIAKNHIFCNRNYSGKKITKLKLKGDINIIGDKHTVSLLRIKHGIASSNRVVENIDEFLYLFDLPRSLSYPKSKMKVLLLENINPLAVEAFKKEGYEVESIGPSLSEKELSEKIHDVSILGIRSKTKVSSEVLKNANKLLAIGAFCIGTNQIDLEMASQKGVAVFNAPFSNTRSVAEMIIGEIIMLSRRTFEKSQLLHKGTWDKLAASCHEIRGLNLGIIGYGHIGSQVSVLAESLGMNVYFYNTSEKLAFGNAKKCSSMKELLKHVDVVTVHVSGKPQNKNLINEKVFRQMKDGVLFLNASRGFVVDINALVSNLKSKKVIGAAIDVFPSEPEKNGDPFVSSLQNLPNVILTPHLGSGTEEAQRNIGEYVSHKLIQFVNTGETALSVNFPQIQLPDHPKTHRLIHIHKNTPGVLSQINAIFAENKINIEGQYLKTNEQVGYVITDVNKNYDKKVIDLLKNIQGTIRLRILY